MNNLKSYFIKKNKIPLIVTFICLLVMFGIKNYILNLMIIIVLPQCVYTLVRNFDILTYKREENESVHQMLLNLLPIDKTKYQLLCIVNAFMWSMVLFISSILYLNSKTVLPMHDDLIILLTNLLACLIPFVLEIYRLNRKKVSKIIDFICVVYTTFWILTSIVFGTELYPLSAGYYFIASVIFLFLVLIISIFSEKLIKGEALIHHSSNNRMISIYQLSTYSLSKKEFGLMNLITTITLITLFLDDSYIVSSVLVSAMVLHLNYKQHFENQTFMQLLPISLKEKKKTCIFISIIEIIGITCLIYGVAHLLNPELYVNLKQSGIDFIGLMAINILWLSFYNFYYHRRKDLFTALLLMSIYIPVIVCYQMNQLLFNRGIYVGGILLLSLVLLIVENQANQN